MQKGYVSLSRRSNFINLRKKRSVVAKEKWNRVYSKLWIFQFFPTVCLVAVTGALSMNNVEKDDDIDLLVVTNGNTVWITRFVLTLVFDFLNVRRRPNDVHVSNLFCLNMYLSSNALEIAKENRNFYIAHEIVQMVPVFDRDNTYRLFCQKNTWVKAMLPHAVNRILRQKHNMRRELGIFAESVQKLFFASMEILDVLFMYVQLLYMKTRHTREIIMRQRIQFHPVDANDWVYKKFAVRLRRKRIPLDKIFFTR